MGTPYRAALKASPSAGRAHWLVLSDDLPVGLVLDRRSGVITGSPTTPGTTGVTVGVSFGRGPVGARSYRITVNP